MTMDDALLANAKRWMGKLPRDQFDMLLALVLDARKVERAIGFRAGQSHAAGLLAALEELVAHCHEQERLLTEELHHTAYSGESLPLCNARAATAAAKGA